MAIQITEKIYKEIELLKEETKNLKRLVFSIIKDNEGEYQDFFVKNIIKKSNSIPRFIFTNKKEFFKQISS